MNVEAWVQQNKPAVLGVGVAVAVGAGLYSRHRSKLLANERGPATPALSTGGQVANATGAGGVYDSSASDLYGSLAPELSSIADSLYALQHPDVPVPQPVTPKPTTPVVNPGKRTPARPPTPVARPSHAVDGWVTVNAGDSLSKIAARYPQAGITWQSIYATNKGVIGANPNLIRPGQKLHVVGN